ncbi:MAG: NAD(P)H-binding protein [Rhodanobacter sp.]
MHANHLSFSSFRSITLSNAIFITGASGHFGQLVLRHLTQTLKIPPSRIVAASRDPSKLSEWAGQGVSTRTLDFEKPETFATAFAGVEQALLISTDALDRPGRRLAQHQAAIQGMESAGVRHVVYLSGPNPIDLAREKRTPCRVIQSTQGERHDEDNTGTLHARIQA